MHSFFALIVLTFALAACQIGPEQSEAIIMTVDGPIDPDEMGLTMEHEHVLVDFIGAEKVSQPQYLLQQAADSLLPDFLLLPSFGIKTLIECTPNYIGRDVRLLRAISEKTGVNIITNTGYYAAANKKFLPAHAYIESAEQLAKRWINEWENGIDGTTIKPGFIKLGVGKSNLDSTEQKIVRAGALTHLATGLKIAIHTGSAAAANDEIDIITKEGVRSDALIVVHAQNCSSKEQIELIRRGAWVSLDGIKETKSSMSRYTSYLVILKENGLLGNVLISQDAFWSVIQEDNGSIGFKRNGSPYSATFEVLIPNLMKSGFTESDINQLLVINPAKAYKIEVRKIEN